jgi:hypothetical protein
MLALLFLAVVLCCEVGLSLAMHCYASKLRNVSLCLKGCFNVLLPIILPVAEQQCAGCSTVSYTIHAWHVYSALGLCSCCVFVAA